MHPYRLVSICVSMTKQHSIMPIISTTPDCCLNATVRCSYSGSAKLPTINDLVQWWQQHPSSLPSIDHSIIFKSHLIHGSLGPHESTPQVVSQSVQPFLHGSQLCQTHIDEQTYTQIMLRVTFTATACVLTTGNTEADFTERLPFLSSN